VELNTDAHNTRSRAALLRFGAQEEGIFRKHQLVQDGVQRDSEYLRIVDDAIGLRSTLDCAQR